MWNRYLKASDEAGSLLEYTKDIIYIANLFMVDSKLDADGLKTVALVDALVEYKYE